MTASDQATTDPLARVAAVALRLSTGIPAMTDRLVARILATQDAYRDLDDAAIEEVRCSCRDNITELLDAVSERRAPVTIAPLETARRRAEMGVPLGAVLAAYRLGYQIVWEALADHALSDPATPVSDLVAAASTFWALVDEYSEAVHTAYRDTLVDRTRQTEQQRSALFDALIEGRAEEWSVVGEAARMLDLPASGPYVAVSAEATGARHEPLERVEQLLRARGVRSVWRRRADEQTGVIALTTDHPLGAVRELLASLATARVGLSATYLKLADTPAAITSATVARGCAPPGRSSVLTLDDRPLAALVSAAAPVAERLARTVLGPVLAVGAAERALLLETLDVWFAVDGSAGATAERLFCHRNTVRNRLQRVEHLTGRSLSSPDAITEVRVALEVVRLLDL